MSKKLRSYDYGASTRRGNLLQPPLLAADCQNLRVGLMPDSLDSQIYEWDRWIDIYLLIWCLDSYFSKTIWGFHLQPSLWDLAEDRQKAERASGHFSSIQLSLAQWMATSFCQRIASKCFQPCRPYGTCHNQSSCVDNMWSVKVFQPDFIYRNSSQTGFVRSLSCTWPVCGCWKALTLPPERKAGFDVSSQIFVSYIWV